MGYVDMGGYPSDQLSQIKMRNRRFQQSCAMEGMQGGFAPPPAPMMRGPVYGPPPMMIQPQMTEDMMMMGGMQDELAMIDQDLNMTRRATRPFIPQSDPAYFDLQRQCQMLEQMPEQPIRAPRFQCDEFLSADMLPAPKRIEPKKEEPEPAPKPASFAAFLRRSASCKTSSLNGQLGTPGSFLACLNLEFPPFFASFRSFRLCSRTFRAILYFL